MNRMKNKLIIGQKQQLNLNQRLTQSIQILGLSYDELLTLIKKEAEENPTLDLDSEILNQAHPQSMKYPISAKGRPNLSEDLDYLDTVIEEKLDPIDILKRELRYLPLTEAELEIAKILSENLDESGFINKNDLPEIALSLKTDLEKVQKVLKELRKLNPPGIFAFHLKDSLIIQLRRLETRNPLAERILLSCLNYLMRGDFKSIAQKLQVSLDEVERALNLIKTLNPRPLSLINADIDINYIMADLKLLFDTGNQVHIIVKEQIQSSLHYDDYYRELMRTKNCDEETLSYIKSQYAKLKLIKEALEKRSDTIKRVAGFIFEFQKDYFIEEDGGLKVLTMKMIAEALGLHESTISRTLKNKYVDTPLGLFELRHFLQKGVKNQEAVPIASSKIKALIQELIQREDKRRPLTDEKIVEELKQREIAISRRGVCKYREELGLLSSSKRKIKY